MTTTTRLLLNDYLSLDYEVKLDCPGLEARPEITDNFLTKLSSIVCSGECSLINFFFFIVQKGTESMMLVMSVSLQQVHV